MATIAIGLKCSRHAHATGKQRQGSIHCTGCTVVGIGASATGRQTLRTVAVYSVIVKTTQTGARSQIGGISGGMASRA